MAALGMLTNVNFTSGGATKVIALLIFIVGILWVSFGAIMARRMNKGYHEGTISGQVFKSYAKDPNGKNSGKKMGLGIAASLVADTAISQLAIQFLPFPLNYFYWMGMYPFIPFIIFGLIPGVLTFMGISPLMSLAGVLDAGGDGTEYVEASKIHWFYSLSPADRDRVREGSDLEGDDDESGDSDDEDRKKKVHKQRPGAPGRPVSPPQ